MSTPMQDGGGPRDDPRSPPAAVSSLPHHTRSPDDIPPAGWVNIEAEYWRDAQAARALEDQSMDEKYETKTAELKARHAQLLDERARLSERLQSLKKECDKVDEDLTRMDVQFEEAKEIVARRREDQDGNAKRFFKAQYEKAVKRAAALEENETGPAKQLPQPYANDERVPQPSSSSHALARPSGTAERDVTAAGEPSPTHNGVAARHAYVQAATEDDSLLSQPFDDITAPTGVEVWDIDGNFVDHVKRIKLSNKFIRHVLQLPVKRRVIVRPGRKFNKETMQSIYEPSDNKGAKWLSCMIQATGEEQETQCTACSNRAGTWLGCMILGGNEFPRCANCEWNRQGCIGSSYHADRQQEYNIQASSSPAGGFAPTNGSQGRGSAPATVPSKRTSLPNKKVVRKSLPPLAMAENRGPLGYGGDEYGGFEEEVGPDITAARLHLRHNGSVFTEPEIMRGVPVEKISSTHPYWEPRWEEPIIQLQARYDEWQAKLEECLATGKNRFLAGRQVNRGKAIIEFLEKGEVHPFQLVAKKFITRNLVNYDTIFRLAQVMEELPRLGIDITPVEWVRERMHEIYKEQGEAFSLAKTVHELYHDVKIRALRSRAGVGNIGRPSGIKKGMSSKPGGPRRRENSETPRKRRRGSLDNPQQADQPFQPDGPSGPTSPHDTKKQRLDLGKFPAPNREEMSETASPDLGSVPAPQKGDEFEYDGYTSSDSISHSRMTTTDWRVIQVRAPEYTTSLNYAQYLHWVVDGNNPYFEHQVLLGVNPSSWGVYQDPFDFHVRLAELDKIEYTKDEDCGKIVIHTTPPSRYRNKRKLLLQFKRGRTQDRFLHFVKHKLKGLRPFELQETSRERIEAEWNSMDSQVLPVEE
ncbi:hypothetical protein M406DRAFT_349206 [Cryphonectria parasitica EP155]|uniref:Uncharacterized protein n=1 Tax=Cryphonectria parasitica (strain ATCC 38755 / EP155) TaxID=660469 RepID=A0A9P4YD16_CRYP1|nr:uncharacterized protein M406DRAFT_349206 [Cryphonectria parasitica EP155]KAF3770415.1 hypothetical protein M406DRAFT_349206 [Cryphonectria parasitica EP155]